VTLPKITGPDMLSAVKAATKGLPLGSSFAISLFDSYDLFKLDVEQLVDDFGFDAGVAQRVVDGLRRSDLTELSVALGISLSVDKSLRNSLLPNAGIIRSAGVWSDISAIPADPDLLVEEIRRMRSPNPNP
jgi:hypothetical protein